MIALRSGVSEQLAMFLRAILLGMTLGLCYDLFGAVRSRGGRLLGHVLDGLFCVLAVLALFLFTMAGDGELRLFVLLGALGGAVLFFCLFSQSLRPLWAFWLEVFLAPIHLAGQILKKISNFLKKLFSIWKTYCTIQYRQWSTSRRIARKKKGDAEMGKVPRKTPKRQKKNSQKRPNGKLTILLFVVLLAGLGVQLVRLFGLLQTAQMEERDYTAQVAELEEGNARLRDDLARKDDPSLIEDFARQELGMVVYGERVFRFGNQ